MKKTLIIIGISILVMGLIPGKFYQVSLKCNEIKLNGKSYTECPTGGCFGRCEGIILNETCEKYNYKTDCEITCLGLVQGSCGVNPVTAKIAFIYSLLFK